MPTGVDDPKAVIGVWAAAYRRKLRIQKNHHWVQSGPWVQVSRLGNPLFNEVINGVGVKDSWNTRSPCRRLGLRRQRRAPAAG